MSPATSYHLTWTDPDGGEQERELLPGDLTVGRASTCDVVLSDPMVSRQHARFRVEGDDIILEDLGSRNGTYVNGDRVEATELQSSDDIRIGGVTLLLRPTGTQTTIVVPPSEEATVVLDREPVVLSTQRVGSVVSEDMLKDPVISESALAQRGVEVLQAEYAALGGGLGSFAWVDMLRNSGINSREIVVVGTEEHAFTRYRRLCLNSQIPNHERLRSHSESCPDNLWGFPAYSVREAWREFRRGRMVRAIQPLWGVFGEPAIAQTWTPRSGDVFDSIEREEERIDWPTMVRFGRVRAIRKSENGRLLAVISQSDERQRKHVVVSARFLHLAVGYPAIQFLPDLGDFREKFGDRRRVVNAYEDHSHVYRHLREHGGTVILRGRGIVASRIIQRLWEERAHNENIQIIHLHRSRLAAGHRFGITRRPVKDEFELQLFNWPKGCWGGEPRRLLERASDERRKQLLDVWGGTTTARRRDWLQMIEDGLREGWYRPEYGVVREVELADDGVVTRISSKLGGGDTLELKVDFVIDCTGLIAGLERSPLLTDLMETYQLPRNALGRLHVSNDFEVEGMRHAQARLYAAGAITLGGPFAAVDSFLGLQFAALRAVDSIYSQRPDGLRRLNGLYSLWQWTKWARGVAP